MFIKYTQYVPIIICNFLAECELFWSSDGDTIPLIGVAVYLQFDGNHNTESGWYFVHHAQVGVLFNVKPAMTGQVNMSDAVHRRLETYTSLRFKTMYNIECALTVCGHWVEVKGLSTILLHLHKGSTVHSRHYRILKNGKQTANITVHLRK